MEANLEFSFMEVGINFHGSEVGFHGTEDHFLEVHDPLTVVPASTRFNGDFHRSDTTSMDGVNRHDLHGSHEVTKVASMVLPPPFLTLILTVTLTLTRPDHRWGIRKILL